MSALSDVARLADVSPATASRALSGRGYVAADTRDRVVAAAAEVGYFGTPSSAPVYPPSRSVGVVVPHVSRWYFGGVIEGIESALAEAGFDLVLHRLTRDPLERRRTFETLLLRAGVSAVIAVGIESGDDVASLLQPVDRPFVSVGGPVEGATGLSIDDRAAGSLITRHLASLGHQRIVHLGASDTGDAGLAVHASRLAGYRQAMSDAGLTALVAVHTAPLSIPGGYAAGLAILADPRSRPTAIAAGSDELAIGVIIAARQLGIQVPDQLSVIGIDGHELAEMFALTTLAQDPVAQGAEAVRLAVGEHSGPTSSQASTWIEQPARLVVRGSTRAPQ